jgi:hypothetical protein
VIRRKRGSTRAVSRERVSQQRERDNARRDAEAAEDEFHTLFAAPFSQDEEEAGGDDGQRQQNIIGCYNHLLSQRMKRLRRQSASSGRVRTAR